MEFKDIVMSRYATKVFTGKKITGKKIDELLEIIRFAPSSYNIQPWKIKIITDENMKKRLEPHAYSQKQIMTCSHLLVFCARKDIIEQIDRLRKRMIEKGADEQTAINYTNTMKNSMKNRSEEQLLAWAQRQTYIALSNALNGAKSLGFDSCPMEGFIPEKFSEALDLPEHIKPVALCPVGYAADNPKEKIRFSKKDVFF